MSQIFISFLRIYITKDIVFFGRPTGLLIFRIVADDVFVESTSLRKVSSMLPLVILCPFVEIVILLPEES